MLLLVVIAKHCYNGHTYANYSIRSINTMVVVVVVVVEFPCELLLLITPLLQVGSITQHPQFDYRQASTQYLALEKDGAYNVLYTTTASCSSICHYSRLFVPGSVPHWYQEASNTIWSQGLQGAEPVKQCYTIQGSKNMAVSRDFVNFVIYSEISRQMKVTPSSLTLS